MKTIKMLNKNAQINANPIGSNLMDYLAKEGILEECLILSLKELIAYKLKCIMKEEAITKQELANRMHTSKGLINGLLDENNQFVALDILEKAAKFLNNDIINKKIKELYMAKSKKSNTFDNDASKRRITVQIRGYDKNVDYEKGYKKQVKKNNKEVLNQLDSKSMKIKIDNFADKHGFNPKEVRENIKNNEMFRSVFAKDPAKQNFYQNKAAEHIKSMNNVKNFEVLPSNGDNAKYIVDGNILQGKYLKNKNQEAKSIDFYFESGKNKIYASHKYTKNEGGAQDNQYEDIKKFIKNSRDNNSKDTKFIAICDGEYYQHKDTKSGDDTRIERLRRLTDNKNVFVTDIDGLDSVLKNLE